MKNGVKFLSASCVVVNGLARDAKSFRNGAYTCAVDLSLNDCLPDSP
jgi:hypothetical protein